MQREKNYNLQRIANFMVTILLFKTDKILSDHIPNFRQKQPFSVHPEFSFFLISSFYHLIYYAGKKTIYYKMQHEKLYNLP